MDTSSASTLEFDTSARLLVLDTSACRLVLAIPDPSWNVISVLFVRVAFDSAAVSSALRIVLLCAEFLEWRMDLASAINSSSSSLAAAWRDESLTSFLMCDVYA